MSLSQHLLWGAYVAIQETPWWTVFEPLTRPNNGSSGENTVKKIDEDGAFMEARLVIQKALSLRESINLQHHPVLVVDQGPDGEPVSRCLVIRAGSCTSPLILNFGNPSFREKLGLMYFCALYEEVDIYNNLDGAQRCVKLCFRSTEDIRRDPKMPYRGSANIMDPRLSRRYLENVHEEKEWIFTPGCEIRGDEVTLAEFGIDIT
ncbi:hypothetical protein F4775DRAFT_588712 [Biscogniauxia sp. FL1348]|nr:hypothetical protein F4775DRAFT_588712 [Biscogniauxia sp. FL1348]